MSADEQRETAALTGDEVQIAFAALNLEGRPHEAARIFDVDVATIWRWRRYGCPQHVGIAIEELLAGRLKMRGVKWLLRRMGKSRRDGPRRYPSASGTDRASA